MAPETLAARLDDDVQVVDIRSPAEFERGHIPGAVNVPFADLPGRVASVEWAEEVVVACPLGESSRQAARLIESYEGLPEGATVANLTGGYEAWDGDLERGDGGTATDDAAGAPF